MFVSWHVGLTTPLAAAMAVADPVQGALFWVGGVLIDADHYVDHVWFNRNWSLRRAYRWHLDYGAWLRNRPRHRHLMLFHTAEAVTLAALAAWAWPLLWPLVWGMLFHLTLDKIYDVQMGCPWIRAASVVQWALWARRNPVWAMTEADLARGERFRAASPAAAPQPVGAGAP